MKHKKKLVQGKDFDGWAWKYHNETSEFYPEWKRKYIEFTFETPRTISNSEGYWVRVKFIEV